MGLVGSTRSTAGGIIPGLSLVAGVLGVAFWVVDSAIDAWVLEPGEPFWESIVRPNPHEFWIRICIFLLFQVFAFIAARLISGRRELAEALSRSEAGYSRIVEQTSEGIWMIDREGRTTYANRRMAEILGVDMERMMKSTMWDFIGDPLARDAAARNMERRRSGVSEIHSFEFRRPDGSAVIVELQADPLMDESGTFVGALAMVRDVSGRRAAEDRLRESEARWRSVTESSPDFIMLMTTEGRIQYVNRTVPSLTVDEVVGKTIYDFTPAQFQEVTRECLRKVLETNQPQSFSGEYYATDGRTHAFETRIWPIIDNGKVVALTASSSEVTERKEAEQRERKLEQDLQEARRLESLGILTGGIAHDFNNLLTPILGHATVALGSLPADSPAVESILSIQTAARRSAELIRQLLNYAGKSRRTVTQVSLNDVIRDLAEVMKVSMPAAVSVQVHLPRNHIYVEGDPGQIDQILVNLIRNAADAISGGPGEIAISLSVVEVGIGGLPGEWSGSSLSAGHFAELVVADTGCGMPEDVRRRIFDPFFTTKPGGRGLGLAAMLGMVQIHRGAIQVMSQPGQGTRMRLLFPLGSGETVKPKAVSPAPVSATGIIMVVDDDDASRETVVAMTRMLGLQVVGVGSGREALDLVERYGNSLNCILLDLNMPGMGGIEVITRLRASRPHLPVLIMSGYAEPGAIQDLDRQGIQGFLQKPFTIDVLRERFRMAIHPKTNDQTPIAQSAETPS